MFTPAQQQTNQNILLLNIAAVIIYSVYKLVRYQLKQPKYKVVEVYGWDKITYKIKKRYGPVYWGSIGFTYKENAIEICRRLTSITTLSRKLKINVRHYE